MAGRGRGRGATLPAWMTEGGGGTATNNNNNNNNNNDENFSISRDGNHGSDGNDRDDRKVLERKRSRSRSRDRDRYSSRDRSRDRNRDYDRERNRRGEDRRDRSISNDRGYNNNNTDSWRPGRKRVSNFDIAPLPGEEQKVPVLPLLASNSFGASDASTKHARKLYVGNLPANTTEEHIRDFFQDVFSNCVPRGDIDPYKNHVIQVLNHMDKGFAFVEFSSIELTCALLQIDGAKYNFRNGQSLIRIRRPNDYKENLVPPPTRPPIQLFNLEYLGISPNISGNRLFIANIPFQLTDNDVKSLLLVPVREPGQVNHKGYGYAEYVDKETADKAKVILSEIDFQGKKLTVTEHSSQVSGSQNPLKVNYAPAPHRNDAHPMNAATGSSYYGGSNQMQGAGDHYDSSSSSSTNQVNNNYSNNYVDGYNNTGNYGSNYNDPYQQQGYNSYKPPSSAIEQMPPTCVIKLVNMVTREELEDDQEYFDIIEDVQAECSQYGKVVTVLIPRVKDRFPEHTQGSIYVQFSDKNYARNAALALSGKKFADRIVIVEYENEANFANRVF